MKTKTIYTKTKKESFICSFCGGRFTASIILEPLDDEQDNIVDEYAIDAQQVHCIYCGKSEESENSKLSLNTKDEVLDGFQKTANENEEKIRKRNEQKRKSKIKTKNKY